MLKKNQLGVRLSVTLIALLLLVVTGVFTFSTYLQTKKRLKKDLLIKLHSISKTLSLSINGDHHQKIAEKYLKKDTIKDYQSDSLYANIYYQLNQTKKINGLKTDIYTIMIDSTQSQEKLAYLGIISGENQFFRHLYANPPKKLISNFKKGAKIDKYQSDHEKWLSAFSPIFNRKGEVVAVVQVDESFDKFIAQAEDEALDNILVSLVFIILVSIVIFYVLRHLVSIDKQKTKKIKETFDLIKQQNKKIFDSINYAQNIQDSIIPRSQELSEVFSESFIYYKAKDVVSGDVPWFCKNDEKIFFAAVDCTGHGVPGALLSVIAYFLLKEITSQNQHLKPGEILELLHNGVVKTLKQYDKSTNNHDGMDISLCTFDMKNMKVSYAGANRPLYILSDRQLTEIKGTRRGIGGTHFDHINRKFETTEIELKNGDELYICSDGFVDQMGGEGGKKFGSRRLKQYLIDKSESKAMLDLKKDLDEILHNWKGDNDQIDDILVMGVRV